MITGKLKSDIDKLWEEFWTGGIANPLTVIEQITFLMYARLLDLHEQRDEKRQKLRGGEFKRRFNEDQQHIRWHRFIHQDKDSMLKVVRDEVFPHFKSTSGEGSLFAEFMKDAQCMIQKPTLMESAVEMINKLPLEDSDTKGDLYEYLLSKLTTAGINGQFRTPRHIIRAMIEMLDPTHEDRIIDPSCGTAGFLTVAYEYLMEKYTSSEGIHTETVVNEKGEEQKVKIFSGDLLVEHRDHVNTDMFHGFDFDTTMLRIAAMNLVMHGVTEPDIHYQDTLSGSFTERFPTQSKDSYTICAANPPFKGSLDEEDVDPAILRMVKTKKTELLFVAQILRLLKNDGKAAIIVPDGVLFGSSNAHQQLRKHIVENNELQGVVSLPSGVFKPYAGVSTAVLFITKGSQTDHVWFYDLQADGFSLDDKRTPIKNNDLPDLVLQFKARDKAIAGTDANDKTQKAFWVSKDEIVSNKYDLSINRYKEVVYQEEEHDDPKDILANLVSLENEILADLKDLENML
ncbi:SAM-dependent DNA methyltransferase [Pseudoalteromonas sp. NEC-BIFX-2020_015]|uniref:type I restriction-modification system subunit M n=1 Tax=Pseudoalteromonas sp. NEC-BIFX-2020_015 TaxID=2729544 RepID=UPI0014615147|nr:class I SAM-dependent DNA methyltransferase [Pseudoalteromonas sp. NEC-BIFX-2020_015]NMR25838.1 SAM-dependent DNA methyltransferase [Pseudoalteromonas sp. NEC-BIFX-2020_015]